MWQNIHNTWTLNLPLCHSQWFWLDSPNWVLLTSLNYQPFIQFGLYQNKSSRRWYHKNSGSNIYSTNNNNLDDDNSINLYSVNKVVVNGQSSEAHINADIPQGSLLVPTLLSVFYLLRTILSLLENTFVDDITVYEHTSKY